MSTHNIPLTSAEYLSFKEEITKRIRSAQYEALKAVNKEMITLYWEIGRRITEQQKALGWGPLTGHSKRVPWNQGLRSFQYVGHGTLLR